MAHQFHDPFLQHPLGHVGELFGGITPEYSFHLLEQAIGTVGRVKRHSPALHQGHQRIVAVVHRVGVIGKGHHLALVFEFPHVHEVGDMLEENSRRGGCRQLGHLSQSGVFKRPDRSAKAVAHTVQGHDQAAIQTAEACGGFRMAAVVVEKVKPVVREAHGGEPGVEVTPTQSS